MIRTRRAWAIALLALALLMRVVVPAGFMADESHGSITIRLCSGYGPMQIEVAMPGMGHHQGSHKEHGKQDGPCAFSGIAAPSLAGADPVQLALLIAFIFATAPYFSSLLTARVAPWLRPPLRGPPATT